MRAYVPKWNTILLSTNKNQSRFGCCCIRSHPTADSQTTDEFCAILFAFILLWLCCVFVFLFSSVIWYFYLTLKHLPDTFIAWRLHAVHTILGVWNCMSGGAYCIHKVHQKSANMCGSPGFPLALPSKVLPFPQPIPTVNNIFKYRTRKCSGNGSHRTMSHYKTKAKTHFRQNVQRHSYYYILLCSMYIFINGWNKGKLDFDSRARI